MNTDKSQSKRNLIEDYDLEDSSRDVLRDKRGRSFSLMMMDSNPTGLTPAQKRALCESINRGESFDLALEKARLVTDTTAPGHGSCQAYLQAITDSDDHLAARKERISDRWRDLNNQAAPLKVLGIATREDVDRAVEKRNARLENAWKG